MPEIREHEERDGIKFFNPDVAADHADYPSTGIDNLRKFEAEHFWFRARAQFIMDYFEFYVDRQARILDIGAGTGCVASILAEAGYRVEIGDIHANGLYYAKELGFRHLYQFDLFEPPFADEFDVVGLFDVLEHFDRDGEAVRCVAQMLRAGGLVVATVPAHRWLWNREDSIGGHKRRYTRRSLHRVFAENGFSPLKVHYLFQFIVPLLAVRALFQRDDFSEVRPEERDLDLRLNAVVNRTLRLLCRVERGLHPFLPNWFGGSLICVARKMP